MCARNSLLLTNIDLILVYICMCSSVCSCALNFALLCFYRKKNRTNDAIRMFRRCIEIDATYVQAHLELFRLHRERQGVLILSDAIKANPDNLELRLAYGHWLLNNGKTFGIFLHAHIQQQHIQLLYYTFRVHHIFICYR